MPLSYEEYNETRFEAYCKTCIDNAVLKERIRKTKRAKWEQSFSELKESLLCGIVREFIAPYEEEKEGAVFEVRGFTFCVHDEGIGRALSRLLPKDRAIILLYYFGDMNDRAVAEMMNLTRATVERHRQAAQEMIKKMLESEE